MAKVNAAAVQPAIKKAESLFDLVAEHLSPTQKQKLKEAEKSYAAAVNLLVDVANRNADLAQHYQRMFRKALAAIKEVGSPPAEWTEQERDMRIYTARIEGKTIGQIAKLEHLSEDHVKKIIKRTYSRRVGEDDERRKVIRRLTTQAFCGAMKIIT